MIMDEHGWSLQIFDNPGILDWNLGPHFYFWNGDPDGITFIPMFSSPHLDNISEKNPSRAFARIQTLLRLVSGLRLITQRWNIQISKDLYFSKQDMLKRVDYKSRDLTVDITLEELNNPFDPVTTLQLKVNKSFLYNKKNQSSDYSELLVEDPLVREVILLLSFAIEQELYLLVNTYKILETIRNDLKLEQKNNKLVHNEVTKGYPFDNLFKLQGYTGYINNRSTSGILSRHGLEKTKNAGKHTKNIEIPSFQDILDTLVFSVREWIDYKCHIKLGRKYIK